MTKVGWHNAHSGGSKRAGLVRSRVCVQEVGVREGYSENNWEAGGMGKRQ